MLKEKISPFGIVLCLLIKTQPILMDGNKSGLNLLLVGNTGEGKSATGNTIVGKRLFETSPGVKSLTKDIKRVESNHYGRKLTVVDSPGVVDTGLSPTEYLPVYFDHMSRAMQDSPNGYHAFLFVVRYDIRLTHEDELTFHALSHCFGEEYFTRYGVLIVTFSDMYDPEENNGTLFSDWINTQGGVLKEMKNKFGGRVVLFDNKNKDEVKRKAQVDHLIKTVDQLSVLESQYTVEQFKLARYHRERYLVEAKLPGIKLEVEKELKPVIEMLERIISDTPEKQINELYLLKNIITKLLTKIQEQDKGTGVLAGVIIGIQKVDDNIQQWIDYLLSGGVLNNVIFAVKCTLIFVYENLENLFIRLDRT